MCVLRIMGFGPDGITDNFTMLQAAAIHNSKAVGTTTAAREAWSWSWTWLLRCFDLCWSLRRGSDDTDAAWLTLASCSSGQCSCRSANTTEGLWGFSTLLLLDSACNCAGAEPDFSGSETVNTSAITYRFSQDLQKVWAEQTSQESCEPITTHFLHRRGETF